MGTKYVITMIILDPSPLPSLPVLGSGVAGGGGGGGDLGVIKQVLAPSIRCIFSKL